MNSIGARSDSGLFNISPLMRVRLNRLLDVSPSDCGLGTEVFENQNGNVKGTFTLYCQQGPFVAAAVADNIEELTGKLILILQLQIEAWKKARSFA